MHVLFKSRPTTQHPLDLPRQNLMHPGSHVRNIEPEILIHGQTPILLCIGNNIRLIPRRTKVLCVFDSVRSWFLEHSIEKSVGIENHDVGIGIASAEIGSLRSEDAVPAIHHTGRWQRTKLSHVFGCFVQGCEVHDEEVAVACIVDGLDGLVESADHIRVESIDRDF